ncbi:MAG: hypothetical protein K0U66_04290 [Gammaproteobacteria bacterium]|nr:hypothetical protein [Gammaproteobacteria bacterium]
MTETRSFKISTMPPSTNQLKSSVLARGRPMQIKSRQYHAWQRVAGYEVNTQAGFDCTHPFLWSSIIEFPCNATGLDLDNAEKALFDLLNQLGKVPDDRYQCRKAMEWVAGEVFMVHVTREPLDKWLAIRKYSPPTIKKLRLGYPA